MAITYLTKDAWHFQYALDNPGPRRTALLAQGCLESATPFTEFSDPGTVKVIFPGSSNIVP